MLYTHRRHLRTIMNIKWPKGQISNQTLYKRCNVEKLSDRVAKQRWNMLGHILRSDENTPAQVALVFAINANNMFENRLGRPRTNLFSTLVNDLGDRNILLNNCSELNDIKDIAKCRQCWKNYFGYRLQF